MKTPSKRHKFFDKFANMESHPMIWVTLQLCLVMQSQLVQAISGSNFHQQCPDQCLCLSQIQVLCNTGRLTEIPRNFPPETQEITITQQNIKEIPASVFSRLKYLKRLVLDSNNITNIRPFAFKGLRNVEHISVQDNPIKRLPGFAFAGLRNITELHLGYNKLEKIDGYAFAGSEHIQMLLLNNCPIKTVNSTAFSGLKNVEFLFLPAGVRNLDSDAFNGLENVGKLKLAYLDLSELKPYTFRGLKRLDTLNIENSDLATIRTNAFAGMSDVKNIRIAKNKIDRIEDFSFPSQNMIGNITLEGNHILEIPSLSALKEIKVDHLVVENNFFPCNCRVIYILESAMGKRIPNFLDSNKCISPYRLNGKWMNIMTSDGMLQQCDRIAVMEQARREEKQYSINKAATTLTYNEEYDHNEEEKLYTNSDNINNQDFNDSKNIGSKDKERNGRKLRRQKNKGSRKTSSSFSFSNDAQLNRIIQSKEIILVFIPLLCTLSVELLFSKS